MSDLNYWNYLQQTECELTPAIQQRITQILAATNWENPDSAIDWNNLGVLYLIEAEQCEESSQRQACLGVAADALSQGNLHPLCVAHSALIDCMIGNTLTSTQRARSTLLHTLNLPDHLTETRSPGLVYLPRQPGRSPDCFEMLHSAIVAEDSYTQAHFLLSEVICRSALVFYNSEGQYGLTLQVQLAPDRFSTHLKLGIGQLLNGRVEGLLNLHQARKLQPHSASILQALYLAYRTVGNPDRAENWRTIARTIAPDSDLGWYWTQAISDFSYIPFEDDLLLAIEPNLSSIVTSVLLAEGDWFEQEMEFWRSSIQAGMTVIDVGANVGVYTVSAAKRVGKTGRVIAIEPFSNCVDCLQESCRLNQLPQVKIHQAAASDRAGTVRFAVGAASELNHVLEDATLEDATLEDATLEDATLEDATLEDASKLGTIEVPCLTLDSLIEENQLQQIDLIKIDAEGHELSVLRGSDRILREFSPTILYENSAGYETIDAAIADYLHAKEYQLFRYVPYLQQLTPITAQTIHGNLNIIAVHASRLTGLIN